MLELVEVVTSPKRRVPYSAAQAASGVPLYDLVHSKPIRSPSCNAHRQLGWDELRSCYPRLMRPRLRFAFSLEVPVTPDVS